MITELFLKLLRLEHLSELTSLVSTAAFPLTAKVSKVMPTVFMSPINTY